MDVIRTTDYTPNMSMCGDTAVAMCPTWNWRKIGEVYSDARSQCYIVCTICIGYGAKFDQAYNTSDASAFWCHIQNQHMNYPLFNEERAQSKEGGAENQITNSCVGSDRNLESSFQNAESMTSSDVRNSPGTSSLPNCSVANTEADQQFEGTPVRYDRLPDSITDKNHFSTSRCCDSQIVDISDDEEDNSSNRCLRPERISNENDTAIELSDYEEYASPANTNPMNDYRSMDFYKCELCGEVFIDPGTFHNHKRSHHDLIHRTGFLPSHQDRTNAANINLQQYQQQLSSNHEITKGQGRDAGRKDNKEGISIKLLRCKTCCYIFSNQSDLMSHEMHVHKFGIDSGLTKCPYCQIIVPKSNLEWHLSTEHKERNYTKVAKHPSYSNRPFKCNVCNRRTNTAEAMTLHQHRYHSSAVDDNTAKCLLCDMLVVSQNLASHLEAMHSYGEKIKCCPYCSFRVKFRSNLLRHIKKSHPLLQLPDDNLTSAVNQAGVTTDESMETTGSLHHADACSDQMHDDDEVISYGEVIPMALNQAGS